jgi:hypothetical protein
MAILPIYGGVPSLLPRFVRLRARCNARKDAPAPSHRGFHQSETDLSSAAGFR